MINTQTDTTQPNRFKLKLITGIILAFLIALVFPALTRLFNISYLDKLFYSRFIFWADAAFLWWYARKIEKQPLWIWPEKSSGLKFMLQSVGILFLLFMAATLISAIPLLLGWHESNAVMKKAIATLKHHDILIIFMALTAGVTEEIIGRGYILTRLTILINNKYIPVIISAVLFSALHYGYNSPREYIFTFLIGIIFGFHYQKYGNIKPIIIVHFLIDILGMMAATHYGK